MNKRLLNKILIIDGSFFLFRGLSVPDIWELRSAKTGERTGGIFSFLRMLNYELKNYPGYCPVVTWDAGLAKRRTDVYDRYKRNHERVAEKLAKAIEDKVELSIKLEEQFPNQDTLNLLFESMSNELSEQRRQDAEDYSSDNDFRAQYHRQRDILIKILHSFGVPSILVPGWEGDDLMTILSRMTDDCIIMTSDKDMIQLISPSVSIVRPIQKEFLVYDEYMKSTGMLSPREIVVSKAIIGDGSDNIPGVTAGLDRSQSVGGKRASELARIIVMHQEDMIRYIPAIEELNKNWSNGFILRHDDYLRNMKLVDLSLVPMDEKVIDIIKNEYKVFLGKASLLNATMLLAEQEIHSFDTNGLLGKMAIMSTCTMNF